MNPFAIPPLITTGLIAFVGAFVYTRGRTAMVNVTFSLFCLSMTIWLACFSMMYVSRDAASALFWARNGFTGVPFIPSTMLHFVLTFLRRPRRRLVAGLYLSSVLGLAVGRTELVYQGVWRGFWGYYPAAGPLYPLFTALFATCIVSGVILLSRALRKEHDPLRRRQIRYVMLGFACGTPGMVDYIVKYQVHIYPFGYVAALGFISFMAYAIVQHRLMDIEVIVKKTMVFAGLSLGVLGAVALMTFVTQDLLVRYVAIPKLWSNVLAAGLIATFFNPLRSWLANVTDRYLFQKKYDYKALLRTFTGDVMELRNLEQLVQMTVSTMVETVKLDSCTLLLLDKETRRYDIAASRGVEVGPMTLEEREPFVTFLRQMHEPIGQDGALGGVRLPGSVMDRLKQLGARLCLPLHIHEDLIGVLCLGKKKSDEEFAKDDLDILSPLAATLAIAVSNAQLVDELKVTQAQAAQREKLAVIGTLSAGINHEICNPLGIVKAQCEAFLLDQEDGILIGQSPQALLERSATIMRVALKQVDRATAITQKLSNFAKPIHEPTAQPVSVEQEVGEVLLLVGHDLKLEKVDVVKEIRADLPWVMVDRRQLQEVLFNLIRNAAQAISPPGTITIRGYERESGVCIEIADTGSGIVPEALGKIYDPFFTTKEPGKGTGLGLFIVRQIVERNKGRIFVTSTVGRGTTFLLQFPAVRAAPLLASRRSDSST